MNPPNYVVLDDIIPKSYQDWILGAATSEQLRWILRDNAVDTKAFHNHPRNSFSAFHHLYEADHTPPEVSKVYNAFIPLALAALDAVNCTKLLRMRINFTPPYPTSMMMLPHVDGYTPNSCNMVYYINDTDGDTVLFNETATSREEYLRMVARDRWSEMARVSPKQGRAVAFRGDIFHCPCQPTTKKRLVINMNLV
tara:strand:+ start:73 stop:660 length:588 start_codon:yes stop_codon:yes gene_type:complete